MPLTFNADRPPRFRAQYRVRNWRACDAGLKRRGDAADGVPVLLRATGIDKVYASGGLSLGRRQVKAIDLAVQAQVLQLLADIRDRFHLTMLFITHDLRVAARVCDGIAMMRHGEIVERGPTAEVFARPTHPYTQELLAAVPGRHWIAPSGPAAAGAAPRQLQS